MNIDPGLFPDVADALGIDSPAIVEKDVYAVQLLGLLSHLRSETFELVFARVPAWQKLTEISSACLRISISSLSLVTGRQPVYRERP